MQVFSHSKEENGKRSGSKFLIDHLNGVHTKALNHLSPRVSFHANLNITELISVVCWLHDLGKYTSYFQTYLLNPEKAELHLKAHSNLGAHAAFNYFYPSPEMSLMAFYLIKMHHSNLVNIDLVLFPDNSSTRIQEPEIFLKQKSALTSLEELKNKLSRFDESQIELSTPKGLHTLYKKILRKQTSIGHYFITNYLFSLLIEADKLDASDTTSYQSENLPSAAVDDRFGKPVFPDLELHQMSQNQLRNYVRSEVVRTLERKDILDKRIFTLAAPTGIGKTMTSLDFVLKLRANIAREENYLPQIIYGLPFINIIEQSLNEYEKTLGKGKVMGHYQYADIFGKEGEEKNELSDEESSYSQKQMSWDTWQIDVVITSFVQLFETLIGNRNKLLKKFRHFADSIIILDEVQTLAIEKLPIIGAALFYAAKFLNARILIMTATQPKIFELMVRELDIEIDSAKFIPLNILENDEAVFKCFNRTKIIPLLSESIESEGFLKLFEDYWTFGKSCLVVVNKVSRSIEIYEALKQFLEGYPDVALFYLSTNITPIERQLRIKEIKGNLEEKSCILVSTQVVEAGVDLDFDMGFRDLGPVDSIVQVAGRINRENSEARKGSPLYIVDFGDCQKIYGVATNIKARKALGEKEIEEKDYKQMVEAYFDEVSCENMTDFRFSVEVFEAMQNLKYAFPSSSPKKHTTVSDFKIIEESHKGISVFVESPFDSEATEARQAYQSLLLGKLDKATFDKSFKRNFNQRIIAVPNYLDKSIELKKDVKLSDDIFWIQPDDFAFYYDQFTGFKRNNEASNQAISF
ncbi:CRISPR-associated helicase Cas3' [Algoriphagus sp.]|uniref:CRISPR-associated helicase Cas3' n=1 Tax=Algoriphagus sp. TaxID=1872435 RepID=UPI0026082FFA|nr:CRISPR-associated helicase Cas3' [Algoriphagus sp.]